MACVVLVTGVSRMLASRLAGQLAADPSIDRIIGVDDVPPARAQLDMMSRTEFIRLDIRQPVIGEVIANAGVDTVVHTSVTSNPFGPGAHARSSEAHVIGTMQLVAACQRAESVRRFVLKSSTACYGSSQRDPAVFSEDMTPTAVSSRGHARDAIDIEGYVGSISRVRPDIAVTILRMALIVGPLIDSPLTRYFQLPLSPTALGRDPRLQLLHESDAVEVLRRAALGAPSGLYNVAGDGVLVLSQALRRAGRIGVPVAWPLRGVAALSLRRRGLLDTPAERARFLDVGRVVATDKLKSRFGYVPKYDTAAAFSSYLAGRPVVPLVQPGMVRWAETALARMLGTEPEPMGRPDVA